MASVINASHDLVIDEALSFAGSKLQGSAGSCIDFLKVGLLVLSKR